MLILTATTQEAKIPSKTIVEDTISKSENSKSGYPFKGVLEITEKCRTMDKNWMNYNRDYFCEYLRNRHEDFPDFSFEKVGTENEETYIKGKSLEGKVRAYSLYMINDRYLKQHWGRNSVNVQPVLYGGRTKQELAQIRTSNISNKEAAYREIIKYLSPLFTISILWGVDLFRFIEDYINYAGLPGFQDKKTHYYSTWNALARIRDRLQSDPLYTLSTDQVPQWKPNTHETAQKTHINRLGVDTQKYRYVYNELCSWSVRDKLVLSGKEYTGNNLNVYFDGIKRVVKRYNITWDIHTIFDGNGGYFMDYKLYDESNEMLIYNSDKILNTCLIKMRHEKENLIINRGIMDTKGQIVRLSYNESQGKMFRKQAEDFVKKYCPVYKETSKLGVDEDGNITIDGEVALLTIGDKDDSVTGHAYGRLIRMVTRDQKEYYSNIKEFGSYAIVNENGLLTRVINGDYNNIQTISMNEVGLDV